MSGVFSIASHAALQYLPIVASQVQIGCAHFLAGFGVISVLSLQSGSFPLPLHHSYFEGALLST